MTEAFPWDTAPRYLLRDRDASYGQSFRDRVQVMGINEIVAAPRSPWQNAYVERIIGSIRRECLDHVIVFDECHRRRTLSSYFQYYHRTRTHLSLDKDCPQTRSVSQPTGGQDYRGAAWVGGAIFLAYLIPPSILFIPLSTVVFQYGLFDIPFALILTYPTILIPFSTWLLMGYFKTIPFELEECALIDGANRWQILTRIVLPLAVPGVASEN